MFLNATRIYISSVYLFTPQYHLEVGQTFDCYFSPMLRPPGVVLVGLPSIRSNTLLPEPRFEHRRAVGFTDILDRVFLCCVCEEEE